MENPSLDNIVKKGALSFREFRKVARQDSKYVRVQPRCKESLNSQIYDLIINEWRHPKPQLIISINGGAKKMKPWNKDQKLGFKRGLIEVSKSAPTWIITSGFNEGVSKLVGETVKDYSIFSDKQIFMVLGIGVWGCVSQKNSMETDNQGKAIYPNVKTQERGESMLDPNHDTFIFFDDATEKKFGGEIEFRIGFEEYLSKTSGCSIVQVIVEGGKNTLATATYALKASMPIIAMQGSRRVADAICDVARSTKENLTNVINDKLNEVQDEWKITDEQRKDYFKKFILFNEHYASKENKLVHIFDIKDFREDLSTALLEAAFSGTIQGHSLSAKHKFSLAMTFNRVDVVEKLSDEFENLDYKDFMEPALQNNQWQFVEYFLRQGFAMEHFLTEKILQDLYFSAKVNLNSAIVSMFEDQLHNKKTLYAIGKIIDTLTHGLFPRFYQKSLAGKGCSKFCLGSTKVEVVNHTSREPTVIDFKKYNHPASLTNSTCCVCPMWESDLKGYVYTSYPTMNKSNQRLYTLHDLFLWALLTQRVEMAKILWKNGKDHIGSALFASVIYKSLQKYADKKGEIEIAINLEKLEREFENVAISVLTEAYSRDHIRTQLLLIRALPYWGRESCLVIANKHKRINFLFHSACQTRLNNIWNGNMANNISILRVLINIPFGYLTSRLLIFPSKSKSTNINQTNTVENKVYSSQLELVSRRSTIKGSFNKNIKQKENLTTPDMEEEKGKEFLNYFRQKHQRIMNAVGFCEAVKYFYTAPVVKFMMNIISYITFLTIFSYVMIIELNTISNSPSPFSRKMEYAVYVFYVSFVFAEVRQFSMGGQSNTFQSKFNSWKSSGWNLFNLVIYFVFAIGFILRFTVTDSMFIYCRTIWAISLSMFYIRFMQYYYVQKTVGPKVIMISRMLKDILFFLAIYVISLLAYGTLSLSLLYSNLPIDSNLLKNIIYLPFWQLFGQIDIGYMEGNTCYNNNTLCATPNAIVIIANAIFLIFANVLLLSLLIAMFQVTFTKVEEQSNRVWAFTRYRMIEDFYYSPILPPPFNVFEIFFYFCFWIWCYNNGNGYLSQDDFIVNVEHDEDVKCSEFEQHCMETCLIRNQLFQDLNIQDSRTPFTKATESSRNQNAIIDIENQMHMLIDSVNDNSKLLKTLSDKVYHIRRHQKKKIKASLTQTTTD